ncbi:Zinc transport protein ZntB [Tsuneonella dongtanensis]|uniref:Zinc transport protein ZntB n=1 Tax=Tsuneonella dongtanensis TaxID=692370 RepID=A0A1B2AC58_9SPHN|nr:CorA family divalent cation transporter [Tsuneonella dongtanensis]ANY19691.1 Zinc transport protein ZntB [Tsuneonella dongtanensis]
MTPSRDPTDDISAGGPLLFGRVLDGQGGGHPITWEQAQGWQPNLPGEVLWLHLDRRAEGMADWLQSELGIPEPTAELLTGDATRPRAFRDGETLAATLRGINFNPGALPEDMVSMQLWSDGKRLISLRRLPLQTPRDTLADIDAGKGPVDAGALVTQLTEHLVQRMNNAIVDMNDEIDRLEDLDFAVEDNTALLTKIASIRRNCLALQRHMGPQHVALEAISRDAPEWFEPHDRREIAETIALLRRFLDDIDVSKESAVVLMDELRSRALALSERTNRRLTLVATVFLPLSFLVGLFGINVGGMPWADMPGHPYGFWIIAGTCVFLSALVVVLFRRLKWI